jgi:hypothetical protein
MSMLQQDAGDNLSGQIEIRSTVLGDFTFTPDGCRSGEHQVFLGADFIDAADGHVLRLAIEPLSGPGIRLFRGEAPFDEAVVLRPADCAQFELSMQRNGWQLNEIHMLEISIALDCDLGEQGQVKGSLSAQYCS